MVADGRLYQNYMQVTTTTCTYIRPMSIRAEKFEREELASYMAISTTTNQAILCPTLTVIKSTVTFFQMKMNARLSSQYLLSTYL